MRKPLSSVAILSALGMATALAACSSENSAGPAGATGGTMIITQPTEGANLLPPFVSDNGGKLFEDQVFDRLAQISDDLNTTDDKTFKPQLASSWTFAPDSMSIAFSINPKARWHDGKPVTASDVRYSFKLLSDTAIGSAAASALTNVDSVTVRDSLTPVFWFKRHTPEELYDVAYQVYVMPEHVYGAIPAKELRTSDAAKHPIGSGRFKFSKWDPGVRLEMVADVDNYRGRPNLDRVIVLRNDNPTSLTQVLSGQADFMEAFPIDQAAKLDSNANARGVLVPQVAFGFFGMNPHLPKSKTPSPIFSDLRVRRALSMAIDRRAMLKNVFGDKGRLSYGPYPGAVAFFDTTLKLLPYDTTWAKALLDSAGWHMGGSGVREKNGKPLKFSVLVPTSSLVRMRYAVLLQEAFRKVGVQADLDQVDFGTYAPRYYTSDFETTIGGYSSDPGVSGIKQLWATEGIGQANVLSYSNKKVDAELDSAVATFDAVARKRHASVAFRQVVDDAPAIWLYDAQNVEAVNRRFDIQPMRADGWWAHLADWSVPPGKRIDRDKIGLTPAKP